MRFLMLFRIQLMYFQKLFTELKNIDSLLRYNLSKLAPIRTFFTRTSGNFSQKLRFSHFEILLFWLLLTLRIPFLAKLSDFIRYTNIMWVFLFCWCFWAQDEAYSVKICEKAAEKFKILSKLLFFLRYGPNPGRKMKIMKNPKLHLHYL